MDATQTGFPEQFLLPYSPLEMAWKVLGQGFRVVAGADFVPETGLGRLNGSTQLIKASILGAFQAGSGQAV